MSILTHSGVDADELLVRVQALERFVKATSDRIPAEQLAPLQAVIDRAGQRLQLSRDHTVVALAGSTGSGKSSLFNALARLELSQVGFRRPTTADTHACVWNPAGASELLDWLGVSAANRMARESALDAEDEADLRGLVLLDLPDFDSVQTAHQLEVDRVVGLADLLLWVVDPQKYADSLLHDKYLRPLRQHRDVMVMVLNQIDRLAPDDVARCVDDLRRLLDSDGLTGVKIETTSAVLPAGVTGLRGLLAETVERRRAAVARLAADVDQASTQVRDLVAAPAAEDSVSRAAIAELARHLGDAAGVPGVVSAVAAAYRHRARGATGWPYLRWLRWLRADPLERLRLRRTRVAPADTTPVSTPNSFEQARVELSVRELADQAAAGLPAPWPGAVRDAALARAGELPDALDRAVITTDLGLDKAPRWWRAVGALQSVAAAAVAAGAVWLIARYVIFVLDLPQPEAPKLGRLSLPTALLLGGVLVGWLLSLAVRPFIGWGSRRRARRAQQRLDASVTEVARGLVVGPVRGELAAYADARNALLAAVGQR